MRADSVLYLLVGVVQWISSIALVDFNQNTCGFPDSNQSTPAFSYFDQSIRRFPDPNQSTPASPDFDQSAPAFPHFHQSTSSGPDLNEELGCSKSYVAKLGKAPDPPRARVSLTSFEHDRGGRCRWTKTHFETQAQELIANVFTRSSLLQLLQIAKSKVPHTLSELGFFGASDLIGPTSRDLYANHTLWKAIDFLCISAEIYISAPETLKTGMILLIDEEAKEIRRRIFTAVGGVIEPSCFGSTAKRSTDPDSPYGYFKRTPGKIISKEQMRIRIRDLTRDYNHLHARCENDDLDLFGNEVFQSALRTMCTRLFATSDPYDITVEDLLCCATVIEVILRYRAAAGSKDIRRSSFNANHYMQYYLLLKMDVMKCMEDSAVAVRLTNMMQDCTTRFTLDYSKCRSSSRKRTARISQSSVIPPDAKRHAGAAE
ncbi:hypothetical protein EW026_g6656 [Hermanssonia centrifuga]|uniref:Uncharacterized protein n=1 Tax=Hermanssonia centrifuga TaxID=98765 RepID=A0A4S4KAB4_9APHY|nr:hypothetical protein EW026_g6656 [Hermanssonia centrifuga]